MSAAEVTEQATERIRSGEYDVIILNFANCDMVGHTGVFSAAVKAVETVDTCVGEVVRATAEMGGISMITADHGNAEKCSTKMASPIQPIPPIWCLSSWWAPPPSCAAADGWPTLPPHHAGPDGLGMPCRNGRKNADYFLSKPVLFAFPCFLKFQRRNLNNEKQSCDPEHFGP